MAFNIEDNNTKVLMDIEEIIIETLRIAEHIELEHEGPPNIYTCLVKTPTSKVTNIDALVGTGVFSEVVLTGELCVCAASHDVAVLLFFLLQGIYDYGEHRLEWYTQELEKCINMEYDDVTPEVAIKLWTEQYNKSAEVQQHNIVQPIVIKPMDHSVITLTPSICDIWTLPRIRRQFTE